MTTPEQHTKDLQYALQQLADVMTKAYEDDLILEFALGKSASDTYYISSFRVSKTIKALAPEPPR